MEYSERYGNDVDEAVRLALDELGVREDQVMVTVLEEPNKGFLGLGQKLAKVRVEKISDDSEEDLSQAEAIARESAKTDSHATHDFRKKNKPQGQGQGQSAEFGGGERAPRPEQRDRGPRPGNRDGRDRGGRGDRGDRGGRDRGGDRGGRDNYRRREEEVEIDLSKIPETFETIENLVPDPDGAAPKFLAEIIGKMGLDVSVEGQKNDECSYIEVKGEDARVVIGKRGQTLDALQYLTNLVSNKGGGEYKRVIIDVEGYRSRREKTLESLGIKLAKRVLATNREARLEPMNPYERKVIHSTLQHIDGVTTRSEGEEPYRRVIISRE
ncbi:MAG: protein jag [Clostridiales Family XIII bacterium]|jgi:spoIIIJ-associated protein|nr:protein jag [Clostridiales Family XIII bacterium]